MECILLSLLLLGDRGAVRTSIGLRGRRDEERGTRRHALPLDHGADRSGKGDTTQREVACRVRRHSMDASLTSNLFHRLAADDVTSVAGSLAKGTGDDTSEGGSGNEAAAGDHGEELYGW
jgi:hypothetical protein